MMGFHVGQLVLCINDDFSSLFEILPNRGSVYTVRSRRADASIRLVEIVNEPFVYLDGLQECWFGEERFRPLDESRLSIFREMLVKPPTKELVDEDLDARIADCERAVREALGF